MSSAELENLVKIGKLKRGPASAPELTGLLESALARLADVAHPKLSFQSRFDLAYNAAHGLALYALRRLGYRSDNRYLVFQTLVHTVGLPSENRACARKSARAPQRGRVRGSSRAR